MLMRIDWQTFLVAVIVLAAAIYVARRALTRLRSFRASKKAANACDTGCGSCDAGQKAATPGTVFVELTRKHAQPRRNAR
jgi:hypothetical protein